MIGKRVEIMIKNLRTLILGTITLFTIYLYFLSANPTTKTIKIKIIPNMNIEHEEKEALAYLNSLRKGAGLIPFTSQKNLILASKNHANYLINNHSIGHYEESNRSGFTGTFASQRIAYSGYHTPLVIENVSSHNRNYKESIDGLMAAIYHRFAFLDFQGDEIGIGINQNSYNKHQTAFVYNMSSHALNQLYFKEDKPSKQALNSALNRYKNKNPKVITYPFDKQEDVPPVFFNELPDPLPNHDVSGFPISIAFNQSHFKEIRVLRFELFDKKKRLVKKTKIYNQETDLNKRLNKFSFVLFPLNRLEWNSTYSVTFVAIVDSKMVEKQWSFKTRTYDMPLHKVSNENKTIDVKLNKASLFYFPPRTPKDLLRNVRYSSKFDMKFIDKNTIQITPLEKSFLTTHLKIGRHNLKLNIQN